MRHHVAPVTGVASFNDKHDPKARPARRDLARYLPLVRYYARRLANRLPRCVEHDDLVSVGVIGLMQALQGFDPRRGLKFTTFATRRIRGAMLDELRRLDPVPRTVRACAKRLDEARQQLDPRDGRAPDPEKLAAALGIDAGKLRRLERRAAAPRVLAAGGTEGGASCNGLQAGTAAEESPAASAEFADPHAEDPSRRAERRDLLQLVTRGLEDRERLLIILYYYEGLLLREIAELLGMSEAGACQMHRRVLLKVRARLRGRRDQW